MRYDFSEEQIRFRDEARAWLQENISEEVKAEVEEEPMEPQGPHAKTFLKKLAKSGWLSIFWPREYGGKGLSTVEQTIFINELRRCGGPPLTLTMTSVVPTLIRVGTEEQKEYWMPKILRGEAEFAIGYSEPNAGTDLASLQTKAVRDGDEYVINGQKTWNTFGHVCTHQWLACRTNVEVAKHKGISIFIVPMDNPGIEVRPIECWGDAITNEAFFDNVRVPKDYLIGERDRGWEYMRIALDFERIYIAAIGRNEMMFENLLRYCAETVIDGDTLAKRPIVRHRLAELATELEVHRLLGYRIAWLIDQGQEVTKEASQLKVYASEFRQRLADAGMQLIDMYGQLNWRSKYAPFKGELERAYRFVSVEKFGGGTNEIQRDIIAQRGLGLPRPDKVIMGLVKKWMADRPQ